MSLVGALNFSLGRFADPVDRQNDMVTQIRKISQSCLTRFTAAFKTCLKYVPTEARDGEAPLPADAGLTVLAPNAAGLFLRPDQDPVGVNTGVKGLNAAATADPDGVRAPPAKGVSFKGPE